MIHGSGLRRRTGPPRLRIKWADLLLTKELGQCAGSATFSRALNLWGHRIFCSVAAAIRPEWDRHKIDFVSHLIAEIFLARVAQTATCLRATRFRATRALLERQVEIIGCGHSGPRARIR